METLGSDTPEAKKPMAKRAYVKGKSKERKPLTKKQEKMLAKQADDKAAGMERQLQDELAEQPQFNVTLAKTKDGRPFQDVAIGGHSYRLKAGIPCQVPQSILDVLNNAKVKQYDEKGRYTGEVARFSFMAVPV